MIEEKRLRIKAPNISIIIPCYNAENTIKYTLKSVASQTYSNFEIILINDGSTDNTGNIVKQELENSTLDYIYVAQKNSGVSIARNIGLEKTRGKYIVFLDADDIYHPLFLETMVETMDDYNIDTAYCTYTRETEKLHSSNNVIQSKGVTLESSNVFMNKFMHRQGPNAFFTFIYKKEIIEKEKISFNSNLKYGEDIEFTWKYISNCKEAAFINIALYGYTDNPKSAMNNISWRTTDVLISVKNIELYLKVKNNDFYHCYKNYMFDRAIWALLKDFSKFNRKDYFNQVITDNNVEKSMKNMIKKSPSYFVKISSFIFCINKNLFYSLISFYYKK